MTSKVVNSIDLPILHSGGLHAGAAGAQLRVGELFSDLRNLRGGELVAALVSRVAGVAFQPFPIDVVRRGGRVQCPPEILVFHGLLLEGEPAAFFPSRRWQRCL